MNEHILGNTIAKLKTNKKLTVGYFGGSITEGACASDPEKTSWRALTTAWLRGNYPDCEIIEINAAIGGTGSDLGAFRCRHDLLPDKPDLVFVEYAVNDIYAKPDKISRSMEGIVRQILKQNPTADLIFIYTICKDGIAASYDKGCSYFTLDVHQEIADYYGIPSVNVGRALWEKIKNGEGTWETLTREGTHPNDDGYKIYAEVVCDFLKANLDQDIPCIHAKALPPSFNPKPFENVQLVNSWTYAAEDWLKEEHPMAGRYPVMLSGNKPGAALTIPFHGCVAGVYWLIAPDSGDIEWTIDGSDWETVSSWDEWALQFTRACYCLFDYDLPEGSHLLQIRIKAEHHNMSEGTWIRIGAFLMEE